MKWDDPRVRVVKLAGASYRADALQDDGVRARAGGSRSSRSRRTSTTRTRSPSGTRSGACRPATSRPRSRRSSRGDEQAVSLWEFRDEDGRRIGLRVLLAPADAWIQEPRA